MEPCARWGELGQAGCNTTTDREGRPQCGIATDGLNKWYSFPLTSLAQGWVDGSLANAGVLLRDAYAHSVFHLASAQHSNSDYHPKLVVTYR